MKNLRSQVLSSGMIGNILEWYDYALYGYLAPITSTLFFPSNDKQASLINTFIVFALGSLARPLGGIILGYIGDRYGRKRLLTISILMMALPTTLMGLLPTYGMIGIGAPMMLCLLRLLQGFSTGGEFVGSIAFLAEQAPPGQRGLYSSFANSGSMIGAGIGAGVSWLITSFIPMDLMHSWGWRVPFLSGSILGVCGLWLRRNTIEPSPYLKLRSTVRMERQPLYSVLRWQWREIALTCGLNWLPAVGYYIVFVWYVTDMTDVLGFPYHMSLSVDTFGLLIGLITTPAMGYLSDRFGRRQILLGASLATALGTMPLLILASVGTVHSAYGAQLGLALLISAFLGTLPAVFVSLFTTSVRCTGMAIGYNVAVAVFGGTTPLVATLLVELSHWSPAPGLYLTVTALVFLALIRFIPLNQDS